MITSVDMVFKKAPEGHHNYDLAKGQNKGTGSAAVDPG